MVQLIQVCYQTDQNEIRQRETKALIETGKELNCHEFLIITWDKEEEQEIQGQRVRFLPLWKWLLKESALDRDQAIIYP